MLLCRQAENVFWFGRYLERAEGLSRAAIAYSELCLDMPQPMSPGFVPLMTLADEQAGASLERVGREAALRVVLLEEHPGSVRSLILRARENLRVCRAIVPEDAWSYINEAHEALQTGTAEGQLLATLETVGRTCQLTSAQITETMTRDDAYAFFDAGRFLERADMVLRVMQMSRRMHAFDPSLPFDDVRFMGLLQCLGAYQMFRRRYHGRVLAKPVLTFLLKDADFPRSFAHCLLRIDRALSSIPASGPLRQSTEELMIGGLPRDPGAPDAFAEHLMGGLSELSDSLARVYFRPTGSNTALRFTALA
jgi:uncharacterized alpha-E superfamily protein